MKKRIFAFTSAILFVAANVCFAEEFTFTLSDGSKYTVNNGSGVGQSLPQDIFDMVKQNQAEIDKALKDNNVTSSELNDAIAEVNNVYNDNGGFSYAPLGTTKSGLNSFSEDLAGAIANTQLVQNVWAEAWIGKLVPIKPNGFHIGAGANVGISQLRIDALKDTAKALDISELEDMPSSLVFPTITADIRVGGIFLPFDVGFTYMTIDSTKISPLDNVISPVHFKFYTVGGDIRWALIKGEDKKPKISVGAGYMFTKGDFGISSDDAEASMNFKTSNIYAQVQLSKKLLFFIPFIGAKFSYVKSNVDWAVSADWSSIMGGNTEQITNMQKWGILPKEFSGGYDGSMFVPQIFGGFGFDIFVVNLTFAAGYDFKNKLLSGAVNFRIAW